MDLGGNDWLQLQYLFVDAAKAMNSRQQAMRQRLFIARPKAHLVVTRPATAKKAPNVKQLSPKQKAEAKQKAKQKAKAEQKAGSVDPRFYCNPKPASKAVNAKKPVLTLVPKPKAESKPKAEAMPKAEAKQEAAAKPKVQEMDLELMPPQLKDLRNAMKRAQGRYVSTAWPTRWAALSLVTRLMLGTKTTDNVFEDLGPLEVAYQGTR